MTAELSRLSRGQQETLARIFRQFDSNNNGYITVREFQIASRRFNPSISTSEAARMAYEVGRAVYSWSISEASVKQRSDLWSTLLFDHTSLIWMIDFVALAKHSSEAVKHLQMEQLRKTELLGNFMWENQRISRLKVYAILL